MILPAAGGLIEHGSESDVDLDSGCGTISIRRGHGAGTREIESFIAQAETLLRAVCKSKYRHSRRYLRNELQLNWTSAKFPRRGREMHTQTTIRMMDRCWNCR